MGRRLLLLALLATAPAAADAPPVALSSTSTAQTVPAAPPPPPDASITRSAHGQDLPERLTLEDAVRIAMANHPTLGVARNNEEAARARVRQAWSAFLPSFTGSFGYLPQTANFAASPQFQRLFLSGPTVAVGITCTPGAPGCATPEPCVYSLDPTTGQPRDPNCRQTNIRPRPSSQIFNFWSAQVGLEWTLFAFGRSYFAWKSAQQGRVAADEAREAAVRQVSFEARVAFFSALAADQLVAVAAEAVATRERHFAQIQGFFEAGTRTRVDVAQSRADLASAELMRANAERQREIAQAQFIAALGLDSARHVNLVAPSPDTSGANETPLPADPVGEALGTRPEPRQLAAQRRAFEFQSKSIRSAYFPALTLALGPSFAGIDITQLTPNFQVSLVLAYPAPGLNPFLISGQRREVRANAAVVAEQARAVANSIRLEIAQALAELKAARVSVQGSAVLVAAARERRELADARFSEGVGTLLELSDAEAAFVNAQAQAIQAQFDLGLARARLDHALGR
jgi:outer membrane protein